MHPEYQTSVVPRAGENSIGVGVTGAGERRKFDSMGVTGGVPKRVRAGENPRTETKQQQEPSLLRAKGRGERGATSWKGVW